MRLTIRYVVLAVGLVAWILGFNAVSHRSTMAGVALVIASLAVYGFRRWRIPAAVERTADGIRLVGTGRPMVVEFYADL
jgi:hypothetical protein